MGRSGGISSSSRNSVAVQPDVLLAEQLYVEPRGAAASRGERELLVAVLEDATHCFKKYLLAADKRGRALFEEAEEWLMGADTGAAFSFPRVCEVLELNPEYIRAGLRRWRTEQLERASRNLLHPGSCGDDAGGHNGQSGWNGGATAIPLKKAAGQD